MAKTQSTAVETIFRVFKVKYNPNPKTEPDESFRDKIKAVARYLIVDEKFDLGTVGTQCFLSGAQIEMNKPYRPAYYTEEKSDSAKALKAKAARAEYLETAAKTLAQQHPGIKCRLDGAKDTMNPQTKGVFIRLSSLALGGKKSAKVDEFREQTIKKLTATQNMTRSDAEAWVATIGM